MAKSGCINPVLAWYEGLSGWIDAIAKTLSVPVNTAMSLAVGWTNTSSETFAGHLALTVTKPGGTPVSLSAILNQDRTGAPGNGWIVQFEPVVLNLAGTYTANAVLTETGTTTPLAEVAFPFAIVVGAGGNVLSAMLPMLMMLMMLGMVGMMMPMLQEGKA